MTQNNDAHKPGNLSEITIPQEVLAKIPRDVAHNYKVIPISLSGDTLTIAMCDPFNIQVIDDLKFQFGCNVHGVQADEADITKALEKYYGGTPTPGDTSVIQGIREAATTTDTSITQSKDGAIVSESLEELASQAPVIKLLNLIISQAVQDHASDIHLEPFEDDYKVRCRIDGVLYEMAPPPKSLALALASRVKVMSNLDISERRLPQDGKITLTINDKLVDFRVSTLPTAYGESIVIRVLDKSVVSLSLDQIGMRQNTLKEIRALIKKPNGIFLVTGPTGSGKTTTLYSALREINSVVSKIITTEDPVEYDIDGIVQVPINHKIDLDFSRCLRAILRQDPDIIMVGEIRDEETAQIAVQSALTGHLVFSTLHTNDAPGAITRLLDMGIEPFLVTSSLEAVLAQRLIRTICANCKESYTPDDKVLRSLGLNPQDMTGKQFYRGKGCPTCNHTGHRGRAGIFELLMMNDTISSLILDRAPAVVLRQKAQELGMQTLRDYGITKIFDGETTPEEILRETQLYS